MRHAPAFASLIALACSVDDVELVGRKCPCPSDLVCENGVCVEPSAANGGTSGSGGSPCNPQITPANFRVGWETPNSVRWQWDPNGSQELFTAYELVTATSAADVATRSGSAIVWTLSDNPELGGYIVPDSNSPTDTVSATTSDGLQPKTMYYAALAAIDTSGCRFESAVIQAVTTDPPQSEIELFSDSPVPETYPPSYAFSASCGVGNSACLAYVQPACTPPDCYENLKAQGMTLDTTGKLTENQFVSKAYLEISVAIEAPVHSYWSQFWLMLSSNDDLWKIEPIVARADGQFRIYQIPLRFLQQAGTSMSFTRFDSSGIAGFNFGGGFVAGKQVRVDEASVKW